jgi:SAM-dependent methyltransferase
MRRRLERQRGLYYVTADIEPGRADVVADIQRLPFADEEFDAVLCVHVLEHIDDDAAALREIRRVLRRSGWAALQVPLQGEATVEDPSITDPTERERAYGRPDHVRMYGRDFADRVRAAGFAVDVVLFRDELTAAERRRFGLDYDLPFAVDFNAIPEPWEIYVATVSSG